MAKKKSRRSSDYFGLPWIVSVILSIFLIGWILGALTRIKEKKYIAGIIRLVVFGWNVLYIVDTIMLIWKKRILRLLNV